MQRYVGKDGKFGGRQVGPDLLDGREPRSLVSSGERARLLRSAINLLTGKRATTEERRRAQARLDVGGESGGGGVVNQKIERKGKRGGKQQDRQRFGKKRVFFPRLKREERRSIKN